MDVSRAAQHHHGSASSGAPRSAAVRHFCRSRAAGGWPGALAWPSVPKVAALPNAPPQNRVAAPKGPMLMVISGVSGRAAAASAVACKSSAASARVLGMTASLATSAPAGQAHAGEAVVLGHHDVPGTHPVDQGKVHAVCAFVEHQRLGALPLDAVGGVAEDEHRYPMAFAQADGQIHHRAAVCVDQ